MTKILIICKNEEIFTSDEKNVEIMKNEIIIQNSVELLENSQYRYKQLPFLIQKTDIIQMMIVKIYRTINFEE